MFEDRLSQLKDRLRKRSGIPGYEKNTEAIRQEIDRLEALPMASPDDPEVVED